MSVTIAVLIFLAITITLAVVPLLPALIEWRRKTDTTSLDVVRESDVDIRYFAHGFRAYMKIELERIVNACRASGESREGILEDGTGYIVSGGETLPSWAETEQKAGTVERLLISCRDLRLPEETAFMKEIYSEGSIEGGPRSVFRAVLADGEIRLGTESRTLRWMHAGKTVYAASGSVLHGRVSADETIVIEEGCMFERLHAGRIEFGPLDRPAWSPPMPDGAAPKAVLRKRDVPHLIEDRAGRWLIEKELDIPPDVLVEGNLVVTGWIRIGKGVRINGSIKSHKDMVIGEGVLIEGSAVSGRSIRVAPDCRIHGPLLAERDITLEANVAVGSDDHPTTVSARNIEISAGTVVCGTIWAHGRGQVPAAKSGSDSLKVV